MSPTFRDNQWNWTSLALHKSTASEVWRNIYFMVQVDFFLSLVFSICENATMPNCSYCLLFIWHVRMQWVFSIVLYMWFLKSIWLNNNDQLQCSLLSYQSCLIIRLVHIYKGSSFCTLPFSLFLSLTQHAMYKSNKVSGHYLCLTNCKLWSVSCNVIY